MKKIVKAIIITWLTTAMFITCAIKYTEKKERTIKIDTKCTKNKKCTKQNYE